MKVDLQDVKKELRGYLKAYRICQDQAAEIARQIEKGEVLDAVKDMLLQAKEDFEVHCNAVRLILGYLPKESAMYRVMALRYLQGTKLKAVAEISTLSGGQQQRIAIARAIVNEPDILLLDEPLGALDLKMRQEMQLELKSMHERLGITFIYVTHDQEEALTMSDKVVVMSDGMIQQIGTPEEIYNEPKNAFVADFIGESNIFEGRMAASMTVEFCQTQFPCVDNVPKDTRVDVVVRPEDVIITAPEHGQLKGVVDSTVFKGMYYEITVLCGENEIVIQSTKNVQPGSEIGMRIGPDEIHVMPAGVMMNVFEGTITKDGRAAFAGGEYACDLTQLYEGSTRSGECTVVTSDGQEISLAGMEVTVEVPVKAVSMSDEAREYRAHGHIISFIYKGSHYNYTVRTEDEEDFVLDEDDLWNEGDHVSLMIPEDQIILKRR